jgi:CRISPR type IV-associated protein Csf3
MASLEPIVITAYLLNGFAHNDPWSPAIDGILAYWLMRERLGDEQFALETTNSDALRPVEGLPLGLERHGDWWWWQCSAPIYAAQAEFSRVFHRRFDAQLAERYMVPKKGRISTSAGPLKNFRLTARVTVCDLVQWHVIGDGAEIERLLKRCTAIGHKIGSGNGRVRNWTVEPGGDEAKARFNRPLPLEFAKSNGIDGNIMEWSIRPPGRIAENQTLCLISW